MGRIFLLLFLSDFFVGIKCIWVIIVFEGYYVKFRMKFFKLDCFCFYLFFYIWDGRNLMSDLFNKFCGEEFEFLVFFSGCFFCVYFDFSRVLGFSYYVFGFDVFYEIVK